MIETPMLTNFSRGEVSPKCGGRFDLPVYKQGCATLENWLPVAPGVISTRPGSKYIGLTKSGGPGIVVPFVRTDGTSYLMEFTASLLRFWTGDALFGAPLELATPWSTMAELRALCFAQDGDKVFIFHKSYAIRVVTWTGTTFTIGAATIVGNAGNTPFGSSGNYPARGAFYGGRLWMASTTNEPNSLWATRSFVYTDADPWVASTGYDVDMVVKNDNGKLYRCTARGVSAGSGGPTGTGASISDGTCVWAYWCAEGGLDMSYFDRISYSVEQLKDPSAWADPDIPELETITSYREVTDPSHAIYFTIASDQCEEITALVAGESLLVGTTSSEYVIDREVDAIEGEPVRQSAHGVSAAVQGFLLNQHMIFLQAYGTRLREYRYSSASEAYESPDLTLYSDHIFGTGSVVDMDYATVPNPMIYCVRSDGQLAVLSQNKLADIEAWCRFASGASGLYESVAVIGGANGDAAYCVVNRGTGYRCIEKFDLLTDSTTYPLDSWVNVASAGATVTGLERFNSKTVTYFNVTDSTLSTGTVTAGSLAIPAADQGDNLVIGAAYTCTYKSMRPVVEGTTGAGTVYTKRVIAVVATLHASYPFKVGYTNSPTLLEAAAITGPYSGNIRIPFEGTWDEDAWVMAIQDTPYRVMILALTPEVET